MFKSQTVDAASRARDVLRTSPIQALRALQVDEDGGRLRLSGNVDSYYHKQLAQEAVRPVAGELQVVNVIDVS